jgi:hypothetical protein
VKREESVTLEMNKRLADDKKMSKKEKDERILWKKNEVADYEATTFSIFYNNALFLAIIILASFYILRSFSPTVYEIILNDNSLQERDCVIINYLAWFVQELHPLSRICWRSSCPLVHWHSISVLWTVTSFPWNQ